MCGTREMASVIRFSSYSSGNTTVFIKVGRLSRQCCSSVAATWQRNILPPGNELICQAGQIDKGTIAIIVAKGKLIELIAADMAETINNSKVSRIIGSAIVHLL